MEELKKQSLAFTANMAKKKDETKSTGTKRIERKTVKKYQSDSGRLDSSVCISTRTRPFKQFVTFP